MIVLVGIISGFIANLLFYEVNLYTRLIDMTSSTQITRNTLQMLARDLRHISAPDSIHQASADSVRFDDVNNTMISYKFTGGKIYRNNDLLQDNISALTFEYFDDSGNALSTPVSNPGQIRSIDIEVTAAVGDQSMTFNTTVQPRNF